MPAPSGELIRDRLALATAEAGAVAHRVIRQTDKTVLVSATADGRPVVVKMLADDDEFWRQKLANEITAYRTFASEPPPVLVPELVHADESSGLLVLTWLDGQPLDTERYAAPVTSGNVDAVLSAVQALNAWQPPTGAFDAVLDYPERVSRYRDRGFLTAEDAEALTVLLARCGDPWEFNHGDLLPNNLLVTPNGRCALLDWEFAGLYLPGFDLGPAPHDPVSHALRPATERTGRHSPQAR